MSPSTSNSQVAGKRISAPAFSSHLDDGRTAIEDLAGTGFLGQSVMAHTIRAKDWATTGLGSVATWPSGLKTVIGIILGANQPMFVWWGADLIHFHNDAFNAALGDRDPGLLGLPAELVWGDDWKTFEPLIERVSKGQAVQLNRTRLHGIRGGRKEDAYFDFSCSPLFENHAVAGVFGACVEETLAELTEPQRAANTLKNLNIELERHVAERTLSLQEAIAQLEEFSYTVSHDIRAPLRAIRGYAEALVEDYGASLDATANEYLKRMIRASHRLDKLTLDVLAYSRMAQRQIQLNPVDLDNLVKDIVQLQSSLSPLAQIHLDCPFPPVMGHEALMMQCLSNLLDNAVKFVPPQRIPIVRVWSERHENIVQLWFEDNGIGIRPEHHERIFNIFEQVNADADYKGTGIGLAVVRKAAEKMNGSVGLESTENSGSRFWLKFEAV